MVGDVIRTNEHLFLGSRLKRLAERMQGDVVKIAEAAGLPIQPGQYPLLATLDRYGPQTVGALSEAMQFSQPATTRTIAKLVDMGLIETNRLDRDQRHKTVSLTPAGEAAIARSKMLVWPRIEAAVRDLLTDLPASLLDSVSALEDRLGERPLHHRALRPTLALREFDDDTAHHFRAINVEWIEAMHRLEDGDRDVLDHPRDRIIAPGGTILFVEAEGLGIVGTCALRKTGDRTFELTKMGVLEKARGLKAGEFLLRAMIERARAIGVETLYLLSNRKSAAAIHLYEKLGFVHDAGVMVRYGGTYGRCDVAMLYRGPSSAG